MLSEQLSQGQCNAHAFKPYLHACRLYTKDFFYPVISIFTALLVAPRFRKSLQSASVYEFLETRFGLECRLFGAATYVVSQLLKLCTTLYLMAVPISMLLNAPLPLVIIFTGAFVTCYSMAGGISAVVYTDVLQVSSIAIMTGTLNNGCLHSMLMHVAGLPNTTKLGLLGTLSRAQISIVAFPLPWLYLDHRPRPTSACTVSSTHTYLFALCYADWVWQIIHPSFER